MVTTKEKILAKLSKLQVGGCTCMTKTPELKYHNERCTYRLASEVESLLDRMMEVTTDERELLLRERERVKVNHVRWAVQDACKHKNKRHLGSFGHNGDDWYRCDECGKEWSD